MGLIWGERGLVCAFMGVYVWAQMRTANRGRFVGVLVVLVRLWCALLVWAWACGLIFRLVCAFRGVGCVLVWGLVLLCFVGRLNGLWLWCAVSVMLCADALTVGRGGEGVPTPMRERKGFGRCYPTFPI